MWLIKVSFNILFLLVGLCHIAEGRRTLRTMLYPKWLNVSEILFGIVIGLFAFSVWFVQ